VIAGYDPADPASADEPVPDYGAMLGKDVKGLRIGVIRHFYTKDVAADPEQVDALDAAVSLFAEAGAETTEITLPPLQDFSACGQIILAAEAYAVHEHWLKERPQDYGSRARERLLAGAGRARRLPSGGTLAPPAPRPGGAAFADIDGRLPPPAWIPPAGSTTMRHSPPITGARHGCRSRYRAAGAGDPRGFSKDGRHCRCSSSAGRSPSRCSSGRTILRGCDRLDKRHPAGLAD
jgi:hypothetical protein